MPDGVRICFPHTRFCPTSALILASRKQFPNDTIVQPQHPANLTIGGIVLLLHLYCHRDFVTWSKRRRSGLSILPYSKRTNGREQFVICKENLISQSLSYFTIGLGISGEHTEILMCIAEERFSGFYSDKGGNVNHAVLDLIVIR